MPSQLKELFRSAVGSAVDVFGHKRRETYAPQIAPKSPETVAVETATKASSTADSSANKSAAEEPGLVPGIKPIKKGSNYGIQLLYDPHDRIQAIVDIVFLHGLTGNAYTTWLHKDTKLHWPSACLKDSVPDARILSFGYDADVVNWWHEASSSRVSNHAEDMLGALARLRGKTDTEDRKIIFVVHSLGGLVTEIGLALSRRSPFEHLRRIEQNTVGIVFIGTPHLGADDAKWATFATGIVSVVKQTNAKIVEVLRPDSEMLASIQKDFQGVLRHRIDEYQPIDITCFYEQLPVKAIGEIVPKHSAILQPYSGYGIHANHMDITKFSGTSDPGYEAVIGEILRPVRKLRRTKQPMSSLQTECLKSLFFDALESRQEDVARASDSTFEWIWSNKSLKFKEWLKSGHGAFWISGKPGSGKSTLMKFLFESYSVRSVLTQSLWRPGSHPVLVAHFFDYESEDALTHNLEGLVRSLLWQILKQNHKGFDAVLPEYLSMKQTQPNVVWRRQILVTLLQKVLREHCSVPICIFIDALDEYREDHQKDSHNRHTQLAEFLRGLISTVPGNVRFCLSSRPYPDFQYDLVSWSNLYHQISIDRLTSVDIITYVSAQFAQIAKKDGPEYLKLADQIKAKASDTFLWVKVICETLLRYGKKGETIQMLQKRLEELPDQLGELYKRILKEMDAEERTEVEVLLGLVAAATRPLTLKELIYALGNCASLVEAKYTSIDQMRRRIDGICGSLLEIRFGKVRFLHETVLSYLRSNHTQTLKNGNIYILRACISSLSAINKSLTGEIEGGEKTFLRYAVLNLLVHAQEAREYTGELDHRAWVYLSNRQYLLWYELFLATSWQLSSVRGQLTFEFSARRLQQVILFSNLNLAIATDTGLEPACLSSTTSPTIEEQGKTSRSLIEDTASGLYVLTRSTPFDPDVVEPMLFFLKHPESTMLSLRDAVDLSQPALIEQILVGTLDPAALPKVYVDDNVHQALSDRELVGFRVPARNLEALNYLDTIGLSANAQELVTPLQLAAYHGLYGCLEQMMRDEADPNLETASVYGTPLIASICGIIELPRPTFSRSEPVFACFSYLLWEGADPNKAAFGSNLGGVRTPLEVALFALSSRIDAVQSFGNRVNVLENIPCANLIYVIDSLLNNGAVPNMAAKKEVLRYQQVKLLFKDKVNDILLPGKKAVDDAVLNQTRRLQRLRDIESQSEDLVLPIPDSSITGSLQTRRYSLGGDTSYAALL